MRPKKVKPAIYEFSNNDLVVWQRAPRGEFKEASWGWVDIKELVEIVDLTLESLFLVYFLIKSGETPHPYHKKIRRDRGLALAFATNLYRLDDKYEIKYYDWNDLFGFTRNHFRKDLLKNDTFVPAGWALAVIDAYWVNKNSFDKLLEKSV